MRRIILIRHSLPVVRPELPAETWQLSQEGRRRAGLLADGLSQFDMAALWSSVEPKAVETARIIGDSTGLTVEVDRRFNEQRRASVPYLGNEAFRAAVGDALTRAGELVFGEETVSAALRRFRAALLSAHRSAPAGDIAIVSHGTVIAGLVARELGIDPVPVWHGLGLPGYVAITWPDPTGIETQRNFGV